MSYGSPALSMEKYLMPKISSKNKLWNLPFYKNQGFQKINDRNWAIDIIEKTDGNHCDSLTIGVCYYLSVSSTYSLSIEKCFQVESFACYNKLLTSFVKYLLIK